jgi:predicted RND superfamily exporter protein
MTQSGLDKRERSPLLGTLSQWIAIAACAGLGFAVYAFVDLAPKVQADFFFSTDDPQLQSSLEIGREFGDSAEQIIIAVHSPQLVSRDYLTRLHSLTEDLRKVRGIAEVRSLTHGPENPNRVLQRDPKEVFEDAAKSPFWKRLVVAPDRSATFVVMRLRGSDHRATVSAIDRIITRHSRRGFVVSVSGVPYVPSTSDASSPKSCVVSALLRSVPSR